MTIKEEPDPFRIRYRNDIRSLIIEIVANAIPPEEAGKLIARKAATQPGIYQGKFIETVDTELLSLHEGNFATYYVRPAEFKNWQAVWKKSLSGYSIYGTSGKLYIC